MKECKSIRIIATSDLHGKFVPWDYALNSASPSGSVAQLCTAINQYRNKDTILVDAGDTIQDNSADIFFKSKDIHPMVQAINTLKYDVWVAGNHDYNYGMEILMKTTHDMKCKFLTGNVYNRNQVSIADGYCIINKGGIRVAVIGMVTPNIQRWDKENLSGCIVTNPLIETRKIIDSIKRKYDVLLGVFHMGITNEYSLRNSGVEDILNSCPEFDIMVSSHEHRLITDLEINGVLVVQNKAYAQTMSVIDLTLEKKADSWVIIKKEPKSISMADYVPDSSFVKLLSRYDNQARLDAEQVIGQLEDCTLAPENEITEIPTAVIQDTPLIEIINKVQMYYANARVSASALFVTDANMFPGIIHKCDVSLIYKYPNSLYKLKMTGAQLKKYMEWSARFYNTFQPGDLTISFNRNIQTFNYDMFAGVNYDINIANEPGNRIENLTWPDGSRVQEDESFDIAVCDYRANSQLLSSGEIFDEDLPVLAEIDVHGEIGGIRELIRDYIINVMGGTIRAECDNNWKLTGYYWNQKLHQKAVYQLANGLLSLPKPEDERFLVSKSITENDLK